MGQWKENTAGVGEIRHGLSTGVAQAVVRAHSPDNARSKLGYAEDRMVRQSLSLSAERWIMGVPSGVVDDAMKWEESAGCACD